MARVRGVIFASTSAALIVCVRSTSANTGMAPACRMQKEEAMNEYDGQMTSSPGPTPRLASAVCSAAVPFVVEIAKPTSQ